MTSHPLCFSGLSVLLATLPLAALLVGCDKMPTGQPDADKLSCSVSATTTYHPLTQVVTGNGTVMCNAAATLTLNVCLYSKGTAETSWGDPLLCNTTAGSDLSALWRDTSVTVLLPTPKDYRTVVEAQVNGVAQPIQFSPSATAP